MSGGNRRKGIRAGLAAALTAGLLACASVPQRPGPVQYLDRDTGVTFLVAARPLIFAHPRPRSAARVRDYATVAAASLDRNGRSRYVLLIYFWSTLDPRDEPGAGGHADDVMLLADDRRIRLHRISGPAQPLPPIDRPPGRPAAAGIYATDLRTLRYLLLARYLSLVRPGARGEARFELWDDERASLAALVRSVW